MDCCRLSPPILLGGLLKYFRPKSDSTYESALMFAAGIALSNAFSAVYLSQLLLTSHHVGGKVRIAVCSLVYRKVIKIATSLTFNIQIVLV